MSQSKQVACVGELLIDFVCSDIDADLSQGDRFIKKAGGAPANVACSIARLGGKAKLAAKVGDDPFGQFLVKTVENEKVDVKSVVKDKDHATTLAFVALKNDGERDFHFNWGAHDTLAHEELAPDFISNSAILHLGAALTDGNIVHLYRNLIEEARSQNKLISFDPNYRQALWSSKTEQRYIELCREFISSTDILKVSEEEAAMLSGESESTNSANHFHALGTNMVLITLGSQGTLLSFKNWQEVIPSIEVKSIDSTGAGDAFIGAILHQIAEEGKLPDNNLKAAEMVRFANLVGAITCTKMGAIQSMPLLNEVEVFQQRLQ